MQATSSNSFSAHRFPDGETRLVPVVARAVELGRGPPWLVRWVRSQLTGPAVAADPTIVRRLARDLARLVGSTGVAETIPDRA
jgi:hypothetical protein